MLRGGQVIRVMGNDTENTTLGYEVIGDGIIFNDVHLCFLKKMAETE